MGLQRVREKLVEAASRARHPQVAAEPETVELGYGDAAYLYDIADAMREATMAEDERQREKHIDRAQEYLYDWEVEDGEETKTEAK